MTTMKVRKLDMISGVTEFQIYNLCDYNNQCNNFFNNITPDIVINHNINFFSFDNISENKNTKNLISFNSN
ncbi:hypothetical protein [Caldisalinibacter kiritimatiensis]|uniref:hypothetical protein n=1 Tax=Caldisalinibacter kiritimatiensis TaxID=1304284 RepID=UPI00054FC5A5|nr:hypothetical protein [Caldisalinibacter kiritimatiensis]